MALLKRKEKIIYPTTQPKLKKKLTCRQKCRRSLCRRCRIWLCKKIEKCFKRLIFGENGFNFEKLKVPSFNWEKVTKETSESSKKQLNKNIPLRHAIVNELDAFSLSKSIGKKVKSYVDDFQDTYLNLDSKFNFLDSKKYRSKIDFVEKRKKKSKSSVVTLFRNKFKSTKSISTKDVLANEKKTYYPSKSDGEQIRHLREDNPYLGLADDSKLNLNAKDKEKFGKLANKFEKKNIPYKEIELIDNIVKQKPNLSLTPSKSVAFQNMVDDWKLGKFSFSKMPDVSKLKIDTFDKKNLDKVLDYYESEKKKIHYPFEKQPKLKQLQSDLREKIEILKEKHFS